MANPPVEAVETSLRILTQLADSGPATNTELADRLNRPKATVYNHLKTLEEHGYVEQTDQGYDLGLYLLKLGGQTFSRRRLTRSTNPILKGLASDSNEISAFAVEYRGSMTVLNLERPTGGEPVSDVALGEHLPLHCSAVGKAYLSALSPEHRDSVIDDARLSEYTTVTMTDPLALRDHVSNVRSAGHAFNRGEWKDGVRSVAAPVTESEGPVIGAVGVIGSKPHLSDDRFDHELPHLVRRAAERIESTLSS